MCFNADTGKLLWEHRYNLFNSDVPPHRIAWSSPAVDPATGNVFAISGGGLLMSLSKDGKLLWERSLAEEFGMWTTHGGRMSSPVIDRRPGHRQRPHLHLGAACRRRASLPLLRQDHGRTNWVSAPEGRPTDTIYANPFIADVNGVRTFFSGGSDGAMHAIKVNTGEPIWNWKVSQRGLNTAALGDRQRHDRHAQRREYRLQRNGDGRRRFRRRRKATLTDKDARWLLRGVQAGYASPVSDGERLYLLDNGGVLIAIDLKTGKTVVERGARHDRQGLTGLRRRQAVHRHGEHRGRRRQVVHHQTDRRKGGDPRPGLARHAAEIRADRCGADRRAWPCLRHLDGRAVCDRAQGGAAQPAGGGRPAATVDARRGRHRRRRS